MGLSLSHIFIILVVLILVFGSKKLPDIMKDLAKGYRAFLEGIQEQKSQPISPEKTKRKSPKSKKLSKGHKEKNEEQE